MMSPGRTVSEAFEERGVADVVKIEVFPLKTDEVTITFESASSRFRQGIWLKTDGGIFVNGELCPSVILWQDTAPAVVHCRCISSDRRLFLYNIWGREDKKFSLGYSSGMLVEELSTGRRYRCNDVGFNAKFNKLVFRVEHVG